MNGAMRSMAIAVVLKDLSLKAISKMIWMGRFSYVSKAAM
jgi:hypothetical protein